MPKFVHGLQFTVHRIKKTVNCQRSTVNWELKLPAFSLIELMVVITLFGISASLITAGYLTFEKNQRVKNAALTLKNDTRLAQNKASSGDKGLGSLASETCNTDQKQTLVGWYVILTKNNNFYSIAGSCFISPDTDPRYVEKVFGWKDIPLPSGIYIKDLNYSVPKENIAILFRPISNGSTFYVAPAYQGAPDFFNDSTGVSNALTPGGILTITLGRLDDNNSYLVKVSSTGEVNESKP